MVNPNALTPAHVVEIYTAPDNVTMLAIAIRCCAEEALSPDQFEVFMVKMGQALDIMGIRGKIKEDTNEKTN